MTEAAWLACTDSKPMLEFVREKASLRKLRLFEVAACRRLWREFRSNRSRQAVEVAERYSDGLATAEELQAARDEAFQYDDLILKQDFEGVAYARVAAEVAAIHLSPLRLLGTTDLLRDIFGNPFRPETIDTSLLTSEVVTLAQVIYEARDFGRMAELAALLEAAGCTDAAILSHLRGTGPHVKGCWALDLVLGKE